MRGRITGPAMSLASLLVLALVLEASLRSFGPFLPGWYRTGPLIEPDPDMGWRHVPSAVTWFRQPDFVVRVETNAEGRLGPPVRSDRGRGRRILLLGDSFAGATQMPYDRAMAAMLPGLLGDRGDTEVVNDGVSGYGTDQEVLVLERDGPKLGADVVVLLFTVSNDVWNNDWGLESMHPTYTKPYFELSTSGELELRRPTAARLDEGIRPVLARSWLLTVLKTGLVDPLTTRERDTSNRKDQIGVLADPAGEWSRAWQITELLVRRFGDEARAVSARPLLVIAPDACQVHERLCAGLAQLHDSTVPQDRLRTAAQAADIPVVDLLPTFRDAAARGELLYFPHDLHWSEAGQALAARTVAPAVATALRGTP